MLTLLGLSLKKPLVFGEASAGLNLLHTIPDTKLPSLISGMSGISDSCTYNKPASHSMSSVTTLALQ